mgnify:CR=1 FL=1
MFPAIGVDTVPYGEGDTLTLGSLTISVLHTPGHTPGGVCLQVEDALFTGDTLFQGSMGRTDFPGGSYEQLMASLKRLGQLPGDYHVLPGHMGASTLETERKTNYYMREAMACPFPRKGFPTPCSSIFTATTTNTPPSRCY